MDGGRERLLRWAFIALVLALVSLPYLYAARAAGGEHVFTGFLLNVQDGNSYLAKMRQGWEGGWRFTLPYTARPGEGVYLFLYYLFLGHVSRLLGWSLVFTLHAARLLAVVAMLLSLYRFCAALFSRARPRYVAWALAALGSGLGWLALPFGAFTSDLWVPEAYPFLSAYATAHFPLGLALMLYLLTPAAEGTLDWKEGVLGALAALALALVAPFGAPVVIVVWGGLLLWRLLRREAARPALARLLWIGAGSGPVLLYDLWVARAHPVLSGWNAQNLTPSPPPWDLLISFSPAMLLAVPGAWRAWKRGAAPDRLLLVWAGACLLLLYLPFELQRRFISGYYVPLACLAALGLGKVAEAGSRRYRWLAVALFALSLPTNLVILATSVFGAQTRDPAIYLRSGEARALAWLDENAPPDALVLAAPQTGLFIPAHTHARVLYGHPFETVDAEAMEAAVTDFFSGGLSVRQEQALLDDWEVDYVFYGPRERALGPRPIPAAWRVAYRSQDVTVYSPGE